MGFLLPNKNLINKMDIKVFVENFADQLDETDLDLLSPNTVFKELEEWTSLVALSIIAMVDEEYEVNIGAKEIMSANTIEDLYKLIVEKKECC